MKALYGSLAAVVVGLFFLHTASPAWGQELEPPPLASVQRAAPGASWPSSVPLPQVEAGARFFQQTVTLRLQEATLEEALQGIARETGLEFVYGRDAVTTGTRLTVDLEEVSLRAALERVLRGTGRSLVLSESGQFILKGAAGLPASSGNEGIRPRSPEGRPLLREMRATLPVVLRETGSMQGSITGTITSDVTGEPLPGVNVLVEGTQQGTATDANGQYTITGVEPGTYTVTASFVGYGDETEEGVTVEEGETTVVDFVMQQQAQGLDEVVVVGYGEQQRRDLTGSVAEVSTEAVAEMPVTRLDEVLQGSAPGVKVIQNSGAPGSGATVRIRGTNSINAGSDPLVVIDGFPGAGDLSSIDPNSIESIQVLKDASATAIYGARGAGGVILVTTKQGRAGDPRIDFNASYGYQNPTKTLDLLNAEQYARLANEANENAGQPPEYENPEALGAGTDWQDRLFRSAPRQEYQLSVSGGSEATRYYISGSYLDQEGIVQNSFFNRGHVRFNLDGNVSDRLRIGNNLTLSRVGQNQLGGRSVRNALLYRPTLDVRSEEGDYTQMQVPQLDLENPIAGVVEPRIDNTTFSGLGNLFAEYTILEGLEVRSSIGGEFRYHEDKEYIPTTLQAGRLSGGEAVVITQKNIEWVSENTVNYSKAFGGRHNVELLAGYTIQQDNVELVQTGASQFASEQLGYNALSVGAVRSEPQTSVAESTLQSFLFRTNYQLSNTYLFTATGRYDGSSRFGEGNKYGFFPSGSVAWRLSEEPFLQDVDALTDLKIRTSYGITGNQSIGTYAALAQLAPTATVFGDETRIGVQPTRVANPDLRWEETAQLDIGVDATLFGGSLSMAADYYRKETSDLLLGVALPSQTGFTSTVRNIGGVQNEGFEFSFNTSTRLGPVSWSSNFNVTHNKNEVTNLGDNQEIFPEVAVGGISSVNDQSIVIREGEPLGSFYGFVQEGLFQSEEEIQNSAQPDAEVGTPRYRDVNEDGMIDDADKQILGNGQADVYGGFSNTFTYGGLQLRVQLRGSLGNDVLNTSRLELESLNGAFNNIASVQDRWTPENTNTNIPKALASGYPYILTSRFIEDGSYLRLQNVSLRYTIPQDWLGTLRSASVYVTGTNLYTFTGYSGYDPELSYSGDSNVAFSIDYNPYPRVRSMTLGVQLGL